MTAAMMVAGQNAHSANHARSVLRTTLNDAIRKRLLVRNAAALADPRRVEGRPAAPMRPEEAQAIIDPFEGHRLHALVAAALWTGLRMGELLALTWDHVDLDRGDLLVNRSPGAGRAGDPRVDHQDGVSARAVPVAEPLCDILAAYKRRQPETPIAAEERDESRATSSSAYPLANP
jgi:integrase